MEEKNQVRVKGFQGRNHVIKEKHWDTCYIDLVPKDVVRKTGEGEEDFVIETKFVEQKRDIEKFINAQAGEVGVYNLLDRIAKTGDESLLPKAFDDKSGAILDYTKFPEDLADAYDQGNKAAYAYSTLPEELKKGRSFDEFAANVTDAEAIEFVKALIAANMPQKVEEKKGE